MTFTLEQIRKYLESQDSMGDVFYNLTEENIQKASEFTYICNKSFDIYGIRYEEEDEIPSRHYNMLPNELKQYFTLN